MLEHADRSCWSAAQCKSRTSGPISLGAKSSRRADADHLLRQRYEDDVAAIISGIV